MKIQALTDPLAAAKFMVQDTVDVTVFDYLMPGVNGTQFLAESKRLQPEATRVLLTSHADKASAIKAIKDVGLFQYLAKPWDNELLPLVIQQGVERAQLASELRQKTFALL